MELVKSITETSSLISLCVSEEELISLLVSHSCYETGSNLSTFYRLDEKTFESVLHSHGESSIPPISEKKDVDFIIDCHDYMVSHNQKSALCSSLYINKTMESAFAMPLFIDKDLYGLLVVNAQEESFYKSTNLMYLDAVGKVASSALTRIFSLSQGV